MNIIKHIFSDQKVAEEKPEKLTDEQYKQKAQDILDTAWNVLNTADGWKLEKQTADGDTVYSKYLPRYGKVFKLTGEVNFPPKRLLTELFHKIESTPKWNPTIVESKQVQAIDDITDVNYLVCAESAGGLVRRREFVNLRRMGMKNDCYVSAGAATAHPDVPPHKKYIRGENGPNCWVMKPIPEVSDRCIFQWLLNTKLNGWLPQYVVDAALTTAMLEYINHIRRYGQKLRDQGQLDT